MYAERGTAKASASVVKLLDGHYVVLRRIYKNIRSYMYRYIVVFTYSFEKTLNNSFGQTGKIAIYEGSRIST